MKILACTALWFFCLNLNDNSVSNAPYIIQKIELNDKHLLKTVGDYITDNDLNAVEGVVLLKFDKDSVDNFYIGYMVYNRILNNPPSFYTVVENKLILIYTGLEDKLIFSKESFKTLYKDCANCFAEGPVIVEPSYWQITLTNQGVEKKVVDKLPY